MLLPRIEVAHIFGLIVDRGAVHIGGQVDVNAADRVHQFHEGLHIHRTVMIHQQVKI